MYIIGQPIMKNTMRVTMNCPHPIDQNDSYELVFERDADGNQRFILPSSMSQQLGAATWLKLDAEMQYIASTYLDTTEQDAISSLKMLKNAINYLIINFGGTP